MNTPLSLDPEILRDILDQTVPLEETPTYESIRSIEFQYNGVEGVMKENAMLRAALKELSWFLAWHGDYTPAELFVELTRLVFSGCSHTEFTNKSRPIYQEAYRLRYLKYPL